jgi:ubiquinone/menaquinone biosynthesis C-methylase UbiE
MIGKLQKKIHNLFSILKYKSTEDTNIKTYESDQVVTYYKNQIPVLQPAEQQLLEVLSPSMKHYAMLDIGVGGGRTTEFFAPLVNRYVGVDYSEAMVKVCRARFPTSQFQFETDDVRSLKSFKDREFDFVLFSFNGLDSISPTDRTLAIQQIKRVLKPGGIFIFSSHNLRAASKLIEYQFPVSVAALKRNYRAYVLRKLNPQLKSMQNQNFAMIVDGSHAYQISNYWVKVEYQVSVLKKDGFAVEAIYDLNGNVLLPEHLQASIDTWLYYFCKNAL